MYKVIRVVRCILCFGPVATDMFFKSLSLRVQTIMNCYCNCGLCFIPIECSCEGSGGAPVIKMLIYSFIMAIPFPLLLCIQ